jgi:hypothetical protein
MDEGAIIRMWLESKDVALKDDDLVELGRCDDATAYQCPTGKKDHVALRMFEEPELPAMILNCFICKKQWVIAATNSSYASASIAIEEARFLRRLELSSEFVKKTYKEPSKMTGEELASIHHSQGIDPESISAILRFFFSKEVMNDYHSAWELHCKTGSNRAKPHRET